MRRHAGDEGEGDEINLTPMLDIVFIMLIFFIVTATFIREPGIDVTKPPAERDAAIKNPAVLIAVDENNDVYMDRQKIKLNTVRVNVERLRQENPKGPVVIQADEKADTGVVVQVMNQAVATGANVHVSTLPD